MRPFKRRRTEESLKIIGGSFSRLNSLLGPEVSYIREMLGGGGLAYLALYRNKKGNLLEVFPIMRLPNNRDNLRIISCKYIEYQYSKYNWAPVLFNSKENVFNQDLGLLDKHGKPQFFSWNLVNEDTDPRKINTISQEESWAVVIPWEMDVEPSEDIVLALDQLEVAPSAIWEGFQWESNPIREKF